MFFVNPTRGNLFLIYAVAGFIFGAILFGSVCIEASVGDLLVSPTRILFEENNRTATVTLVNTGTEPATYRISFIQLLMTEDGGMEEIKESNSEELFAHELVRFSPRQILLPPGMPQMVRMQLRKPADLNPGEYRSHLLFRAVPSTSELVDSEDLNTDVEESFSIKFTPIYGISIPVIVRHGSTSATVCLSNLDIRSKDLNIPVLSFQINRKGNCSVYGNLMVTFIPQEGPEYIVVQRNGIAVYTPNLLRRMNMELNIPPDIEQKNGKLYISYREPEQKGGALLAEAEIKLP
jgi:hypothetical protein